MSRIRKSFAVMIATVAIGGGIVAIAPSASAALCGYPPVECPVTDTNPPEPQRIGATPAAAAQAGMTLPSQETARETPPTAPPAKPSVNKIGEAPRIPAERGDTVRVRTTVTPATTYRVKVKRNDGPYNFVGTVTANANGSITLPAIQYDRRGTYTIALEDGAGSTFYVKVDVE